jgi:hypothetical protein
MTTRKTVPAHRARRRKTSEEPLPSDRPLRGERRDAVLARFDAALARADGVAGAQCVHELWMRGEIGLNVEALLTRLWSHAAASIPDWLPMRYVDWLPTVYDVTARFRPPRRGRHNVYLVLLDYSDSRPDPYGIYVGMTHYSPAERFDQHKAGIRAAGSVLHRGLEALTGPTRHLQRLQRNEAARVEEALAEALRATGLFVQGGH